MRDTECKRLPRIGQKPGRYTSDTSVALMTYHRHLFAHTILVAGGPVFVLRLAPGSFYSFLIVEVISRKSVEYADIYDAKEAEAEGDLWCELYRLSKVHLS